MSSTVFAPVTLELPARLLAERLALLLAGACAVFIEAAMLRQPQGVHGAGLLAGCVLVAWLWSGRRASSRVRRAVIEADGSWRLGFEDGRTATASLAAGSRVLGPTAVLRWRVEGRCRALWLTPADLPRESLRVLRVRLSGVALRVGT